MCSVTKGQSKAIVGCSASANRREKCLAPCIAFRSRSWCRIALLSAACCVVHWLGNWRGPVRSGHCVLEAHKMLQQ